MQKKLGYALMTLAFVLVLVACGSKNNSNGSEPSQSLVASEELVIKAKSWEFDKAEYIIPKDTPVKITVENLDGAHGVLLSGADVKIRGGKSEVVTLAAGTYEFRCNIQCGAGHGKMTAKLIVQ
ncbi:cupredoxin domain-containing protein [Cohnella yongneupensis]|uniref:Cupredoxin domain-containing protein n=1 Tax=Cohnella yongneupensis TaxID=425006 RepID=A0ABW0QYD4_9BACL